MSPPETSFSTFSLPPRRGALRFFPVILSLGIGLGALGWQETGQPGAEEALSSSEFSRMIEEFSEEGGYFLSDNFVSNETSYLHVVEKLRHIAITGRGAYIGVGPEQNFTYIAKLRPSIAFIVDIRREAMLQHLLYKAIFHLCENRAEFLSMLFSRPLDGEMEGRIRMGLPELVDYFDSRPADEEFSSRNLKILLDTVEKDFKISLSSSDRDALKFVHAVFREESLDTRFWFRGRWSWGFFPTFRSILLEQDLEGDLENFLADEEDYRFLRDMHLRNRIIPVVGDFAGDKALASVAAYLKENGYELSVFYTSNVEQYLFRNGVFGAFVENVRRLPSGNRSLFIRAFTGMRGGHPARRPGHRLTTVLQKVDTFLDDYEQDRYTDYWSLVTTNFISGSDP